MADLLELSRSECEGLLRLGVVGRVAIATSTGPHILPLNYAVSRGDVVVCTSPYSVLGTYGRDSLLAFEVDHFEHPDHHGWSVVVRGRASAVENPDELSDLVKVLPRPWAVGQPLPLPAHPAHRGDRTPPGHRLGPRGDPPGPPRHLTRWTAGTHWAGDRPRRPHP